MKKKNKIESGSFIGLKSKKMEKKRPGQGGRDKPAGRRRIREDNPRNNPGPESEGDRGERPYEKRKTEADDSWRDKKPVKRSKTDVKPYEKRGRKSDDSLDDKGPVKKYRSDDIPYEKRTPRSDDSGGKERPARKYNPDAKPYEKRTPRSDDSRRDERPARKYDKDSKPYEKRTPRSDDSRRDERPARKYDKDSKPYEKRGKPGSKPWIGRNPIDFSKPRHEGVKSGKDGLIRLNKYIANAGISSRREADKLIQAGVVRVNGKVITELGYKISPGDKVQYEEQTINKERTKYVLLNKPKGYITTVDDPEKRKTVMSLIEGACKERVYPVGRLDRNTTGLLLFTNDGAIAKKLTHPKYGIKKIYHVELDKSLSRADLEKIRGGMQLDDGPVEVDKIEYIEETGSKNELGVELHSGKNRVIRRIFETLEYKVVRLDRVYYAGLTKKNLPRGHWRLLEEQEINMLKMISSS